MTPRGRRVAYPERVSRVSGVRGVLAVMVLFASAMPGLAATTGHAVPTPAETASPTRARLAAPSTHHVLRAIAVDVDRDGDLDLLATTTEEPLVVWLNDGLGHLTPARPIATPRWRGHSARLEAPDDEATQDGPRHYVEGRGADAGGDTSSSVRAETGLSAAAVEPARGADVSRGPPERSGV